MGRLCEKHFLRLSNLTQGIKKNEEQARKVVNSPYNEEVVAINVPRLQGVFRILEHNLGVTPEIGSHDRSLKVSTRACWAVWDACKGENPWDVEVISKLEGCIRRDERHTIHCISLLPIDNWSRILKPNSTGCVYHAIMV